MTPTNKASTLRIYAVALLCVGLASYLYNAQEGTFGPYRKGISGLIATGVGATLALVFSFFAAKNLRWAHYAGAILSFMFLIVGFKNAFMIARGLAANTNPPHEWYKATVFGGVAVASLFALMSIAIYLRREQ
jgi:hypothetical protein